MLTHAPPLVAPKQDDRLTFTFVTASNPRSPKPWPFGSEDLGDVQLEKVGVEEFGPRTRLRFRVKR